MTTMKQRLAKKTRNEPVQPPLIRVERYGRRWFALYEGDMLLAVVCYRKGAEALRQHIGGLRQRVVDLEARLGVPIASTLPGIAPPQPRGVRLPAGHRSPSTPA